MTAAAPAPTLDDLLAPFGPAADRFAAEPVPAAALPQPYRRLLDHTHHMTVTVEQFHGGPVDVRVLDRVHRGDDYARRIVLTRRRDGAAVQFGLVRIDLAALPPAVKAEILGGHTPLGRVLISHDVLRTVRPTAFLRVTPSAALCEALGLTEPEPLYGRLGVLTVDGKPAIRVCEVLAPTDR